MREIDSIRASCTVLVVMLVVVLLSYCSSQQSSDRDNVETPSDRALVTDSAARDTVLQLTYSSGISSIFEDSKGRLWLGSQKEGVCRFNGESFDRIY